MAHVPPVYPLVGNWWKTPATPAGGPATVTLVPFQLYVSPYQQPIFIPGQVYPNYLMVPTIIKVAPGTGVFKRLDIIQPDNTVAAYYVVLYKEIYYKGFVSSFEGLSVFQCTTAGGTPIVY